MCPSVGSILDRIVCCYIWGILMSLSLYLRTCHHIQDHCEKSRNFSFDAWHSGGGCCSVVTRLVRVRAIQARCTRACELMSQAELNVSCHLCSVCSQHAVVDGWLFVRFVMATVTTCPCNHRLPYKIIQCRFTGLVIRMRVIKYLVARFHVCFTGCLFYSTLLAELCGFFLLRVTIYGSPSQVSYGHKPFHQWDE